MLLIWDRSFESSIRAGQYQPERKRGVFVVLPL
jgi:hypothetical protein